MPLHLVGFSMGGLIAQELTLSRPDLVRTLTLGCTSPGGPDAVLLTQEVAELFVELQDLPAREAAVRAAPVVYAESTPRSRASRHRRADGPADLPGRLPACSSSPSVATAARGPRLAELDCPVLILHGTPTCSSPGERARCCKRAIPHAQVHVLPGAGHIFTTDATESTAGGDARVSSTSRMRRRSSRDPAPVRQHHAGRLPADCSRDTAAHRGAARRR